MKNQNGLTLVELLAALTILFIISAVIYSIFFSYNRNYNQISQKNNLAQNANIILATIKNYHLNNDQYFINYDNDNYKLFIGESTPASKLLNEGDIKVVIEAGVTQPSVFKGEMSIITKQPLTLKLKLFNKQGQTYEVETILKRY
ncbi:PilW family protein [Mesobacillus thioparans]|uniref:PilW family protein n=1 Tax=Mesobacillus thioparans TaxID=370439 RepID=UPI0039F0C1AD